ncbi:acyl-CoA synthetase [Pandoraea cepalis]|uniref:Long-chain-fatty-acid--CoA ligase n=1 Tax=Pandoraea cepalis TaxID=2508294 RepID=A0A5E4V6Q7_9BURK|nr:acyl-CoA synthetase [Pandoraea cepalis]VVE07947.1 Long-chain-fatty-acid--CoA ligase [Pandoraea cepalis]
MSFIHMTPSSARVMNLAYFATRNARRFPNHSAIVFGEQQWTWQAFDERVSALAAGLRAVGVGAGDTVLAHSRNSNEMIEAMVAVFRLGAVWVPTNFRLAPGEVVTMARVAEPTVFLCQTDYPEHAAAVVAERPGCNIVWFTGENAVPDESPHVSALIDRHLSAPMANAVVERDTPCWLFFTSGTTGSPKGAVLTHGQLAFVINNHLCDLMPGLTHEDGSLVVAPISHGAGMHQLNVMARGGTTVMMPAQKLDPAQAFALIERYRLTNMFTVPTILKMLVEHPAVDAYDHASLRYVIYAGASMYEQDQKRALAKLGPVLVQYYGLGEVTGNITVLPTHDHNDETIALRPRTCGVERSGMQVTIQDDAGNELGPGETGEVCVIGPAVFAGYYRNPEANAKSFRDGWFRTGDIGHMDENGYVYLTGRASDMYISGGSNVYPREIEELILTHGAINEVAVVGVPDAQWGEVGVAVCVLHAGERLDESALQDWLKTRIAKYKVPKRMVFWDALPKSGYGKVPKRMVLDELKRRDEASQEVEMRSD